MEGTIRHPTLGEQAYLEIREAFEIREMLEALAARRACAHRSGDVSAEMARERP